MRLALLTATAGILFLSSCDASAADPKTATATFSDRNGETMGVARLMQGPKGLFIDVAAGELPPGPHGLHFHAVGVCDDANDGFKASKSHVTHDKGAHGLLNAGGPEDGDLPNIFAASDGIAKAQFYTEALSLDGRKGTENLLDKDRSALIIHANEDDQMSQPIGNAGDRIACGVVLAD